MPREWDLTLDLGAVEARLRPASERAVDYGVELVARGTDRAIPRDTGRTARSQVTGRDGLTGHVAYLSSKAVPLHENTHERHRRGGRAKFLETTLAGSAAAIRRKALAELRAALGG